MSDFETRRLGLGGHDVAAIMKSNPFQTPLDVYRAKVEAVNTFELGYIQARGLALEPFLIEQYLNIYPSTEKLVCDERFVHADYSFFHCHPDGVLGNRILECKAPTIMKATEWGEEGTFNIPDYIKIQCAWYCAVLGSKMPELSGVDILVNGLFDLKIYKYERDHGLESLLMCEAKKFWEAHIVTQIPPEPVNMQDLNHLYRKSNGMACEANNDVWGLHVQLNTAKHKLKELEKEESALTFKIKLFMLDNEECFFNGQKISTYATQQANRVDIGYLKEKYPDIYKESLKTTESRTLRIKGV